MTKLTPALNASVSGSELSRSIPSSSAIATACSRRAKYTGLPGVDTGDCVGALVVDPVGAVGAEGSVPPPPIVGNGVNGISTS